MSFEFKNNDSPRPEMSKPSGFDPDKRVEKNKEGNDKIQKNERFDPDKRIDVNKKIMNATDLNSKFDLDKKNDIPYYSSYDERINHTPVDSENGRWDGERGESKFIPSEDTEKGRAAISKLKEYGMDGLEYKNGEPDYSKCSEGAVKIDNMTTNRASNFDKADIKLAEKWNDEARNGKKDWTDEDVLNYRKENKLSWHECCDMETMHLVSRDIHGGETSIFLHSGGVAECKIRDNLGGGFDE